MKKVDTIKAVLGLVTSVGVGAIVGDAVKLNTKSTSNVIMKGCIMVGSIVLSNMVADKAVEYAEDKIDNAVNGIKEVVRNGELD